VGRRGTARRTGSCLTRDDECQIACRAAVRRSGAALEQRREDALGVGFERSGEPLYGAARGRRSQRDRVHAALLGPEF